jgi:hypothetical protein
MGSGYDDSDVHLPIQAVVDDEVCLLHLCLFFFFSVFLCINPSVRVDKEDSPTTLNCVLVDSASKFKIML